MTLPRHADRGRRTRRCRGLIVCIDPKLDLDAAEEPIVGNGFSRYEVIAQLAVARQVRWISGVLDLRGVPAFVAETDAGRTIDGGGDTADRHPPPAHLADDDIDREIVRVASDGHGHDRIRHDLNADGAVTGERRGARARLRRFAECDADKQRNECQPPHGMVCTTPQAIRAPAFPEGWDTRSSAVSCRTTARPTGLVISPAFSEIECVVKRVCTSPFASAVTLPKSPA